MSVRKRGKIYYYDFMVNGKRYVRPIKGCTSKREAEEYEKKIKEDINLAGQLNTEKAIIETFSNLYVGQKEKITLTEAMEKAINIASPNISDKQLKRKLSMWADFCAFMQAEAPEAVFITDVQKVHAGKYTEHIKQYGRYKGIVEYESAGKTREYKSQDKLATRTYNSYITTLKWVFETLKDKTGQVINPFESVKLIRQRQNDKETRESFTEEEVTLIVNNFDNEKAGGTFCKPLFMVALHTGLREGDICSLKWADIDLQNGNINLTTRKTGANVIIPMLPSLKTYIEEVKETAEEGVVYVFPELAEMYKNSPNRISYRIKKYLQTIGIQGLNTEGKEGGRKVSVKDLHSCRHTFAYMAGVAGIPLPIVQSILGHMSPEMTKHYQAHSTIEDKRKYMGLLSDSLPAISIEKEPIEAEVVQIESAEDKLRRAIKEKIDSLPESVLVKLNEILDDVL